MEGGYFVGTEKFSKITSVEVYNFMAFKHAKAYFDEKGIINIKGYNSSGKSAFEVALAVCLMNMYVAKQNKFIRHGEDYFRVIVTFDDGISIVRDKYVNGQSLYEMYKETECVFTTKQGNMLAKISGVPSPIKSYLELVETDIGYLNYQTCKDPLWLIDTKGAENYTTLNEVLKTEEISRANAMLNADVNSLNSEIAMIESELQRKELQLHSCQGITEGLILALSEKEDEMSVLMYRERLLNSICATLESLSKLRDIPEVEKLNVTKQIKISTIYSNIVNLLELKDIPEVSRISVERLRSLNNLGNISAQLSESFVDIPEVLKIEGLDKELKLKKIVSELKELLGTSEKLLAIENEEKSLLTEKEHFVEEAKKEGKFFVECENCGTLLEVSAVGV